MYGLAFGMSIHRDGRCVTQSLVWEQDGGYLFGDVRNGGILHIFNRADNKPMRRCGFFVASGCMPLEGSVSLPMCGAERNFTSIIFCQVVFGVNMLLESHGPFVGRILSQYTV